MKTTLLAIVLFLTGLDLWAQVPGAPGNPADAPIAPTLPASPAADASGEEIIPAGNINFQSADVNQVLDVYSQLVGRTLLRPATLPGGPIVLKTLTPLTKTEAIEALQAVLAINGISVVNIGDKFVKVVPSADAGTVGGDVVNDGDPSNLPLMGSYVTHIVQLKYVKPSEMVPAITPFAKLNSIIPLDSNGILIIRDYAENVKRMLEIIDQVDVSVPAEYISEVIPIKYALAEDIANALNSLGGSGGSTVSFGSSPGAATTVSGVAGRTGTTGTSGLRSLGIQNNVPGGATAPGTAPNGTPSSATPFQARLQAIIQRASTGGGQSDQIQIFGQTKIIADQRSNSLLVFATQADMDRIKEVVAKLDVLLSQVLIEAAIVDVTLGHTFNLGVSAAENPHTFSPSEQIVGGGGINNGQSFLNTIFQSSTNYVSGTNIISSIVNSLVPSYGTNSSSSFANSLPSGFSYLANIGPSWDVALQAAQSDNSATVIQRPRIQTSQAKAASFFVGQTVPYITSSFNNGVTGNSSSYSQLSVGVELDVTPFINPDGLVVMDINQEIDDLNGSTAIEGVGNVPNTIKRTLSSEIAVKDRDTIMLGGFVRSDKSNTKSGVPFLSDIPLLGNLFTQRSDSKDRNETVVLIRPTVLRTPTEAAAQAVKEEQRLPGIAHAEADDEADAQKQIEAERKAELKATNSGKRKGGIFETEPPSQMTVNNTNGVPVVTNSVPTVTVTNTVPVAQKNVPAKTAATPPNSKPAEQPNPADGLY
jgi:general secretion pathway protein D